MYRRLLLPSEHVGPVTQKELWSFMIYCFIIFSAISVHLQIQGRLQDILKGQHFLYSLFKGQSTYHFLHTKHLLFPTYKALTISYIQSTYLLAHCLMSNTETCFLDFFIFNTGEYSFLILNQLLNLYAP